MKNATVAKSVDEVGQVMKAKGKRMPKSRGKAVLKEPQQMNRREMPNISMRQRSVNMKGETPASMMMKSLAV